MKNYGKTVLRAMIILTSWAWFLNTSANAGLWWATNSTVKYKEDVGADIGYPGSYKPTYWNKDESDQYLFTPLSSDPSKPGALYSIPALRAAASAADVTPIVSGNPTNFFGCSWKGGAISDDLGRVLTGNATAGETNHTSFPVTSPWTKDVTAFYITNLPAGMTFDGLDFSHTSEYLYSNIYEPSASRRMLYKWNVVNLTNSGMGLTSNSTFVTSCVRVRNVSVYYIGGKDLVYYGEGTGGSNVYVWDTVANSETLVCTNLVGGPTSNDIVNVKVGGVGLGQMHLYVQHDCGAMEILDLAADGKSATLVRSFSRDEMSSILGATWTDLRAFDVANDEEYAFFGHAATGAIYVVWSILPEISLLGTNGAALANGAAADASIGTDFGSFAVGAAPMTGTFAITNSGNMALAISGVTTNGSSSFQCADVPAVVSPGGVSNFTITFNPSAVGTCTAAVTIAHNNTNTPFVVNLRGTAGKRGQTITFPAIADQAITNVVGLRATASSGLPVSFSVGSGSALITGGTNLSFTGAGIVRIIAAQAGDGIWSAAPNVTNSFTVSVTTTSFCADIDGDGIADLVTVSGSNWYVWFSSSEYQVRGGPYDMGISGTSLAGDVDGDGIADLITVIGSNWYVWFSTSEFQVRGGPYDLGLSGMPVTGDVDGDRLADLMVVSASGGWYVWFSTAEYLVRSGPYDLGIAGIPVTGDVDGDRLADLLSVVGSNWYVWFSTSQYLVRGGPYDMGISGTPSTGDVDGDGLADLIVIVGSDWYAWFSTAQYLTRGGPYTMSLP